jgi:hypothetical protein
MTNTPQERSALLMERNPAMISEGGAHILNMLPHFIPARVGAQCLITRSSSVHAHPFRHPRWVAASVSIFRHN